MLFKISGIAACLGTVAKKDGRVRVQGARQRTKR